MSESEGLDIKSELSNLSELTEDDVFVEEKEKLEPIGIYENRFTLYKIISSSKKAKRKRLSRGRKGVKKTQILEEKAGMGKKEILEEISRDETASQIDRKELSPQEFKEYTQRLLKYYQNGEIDYFVCDLETQQKEWYHEKGAIIGYSVADPKERCGYFVGINHPELERSEEDAELVNRCIVKLHRNIPVVNHNIMYDLKWLVAKTPLETREIEVKADTMHQCSICITRDRLNAGEKMSLKHMARRVLDMEFKWEDYLQEALKSIRLKINRVFWNIKYDLVSIYASFDSIITLQLYEAMEKRMQRDDLKFVEQLMLDAIPVFMEIEMEGVKVDVDLRDHLLKDYKKKMKRIKEAFAQLPEVKNYNEDHDRNCLITSTDDLAELFFTPKYYSLMPIEKTDKGNASTNKDVLEEIASVDKPEFREERKTANLILRYRSVKKLESTYLSPVEDQMTGEMFLPDYNLVGARSGRISSYFHTIPGGNDIKRIFTSKFEEEGGLVFSGDYSQLEVRVIAGLSGDDKLRNSYQKGYDIHRYTASQIFDKPMEKISTGERSYAKTIVFGILYGKTDYTLAQDLDISTQEAQELLDFFFKGFPKIKEWVDKQHEFVKENGYVVTPWGRRRYIPWINSSEDWKRGKALRIAQNSPIQGMASDICLSATIRMQNAAVKQELRSSIIGTVHDSIESDTHPSELYDMLEIMRYHSEEYCNTHEDFDFMSGVPLKFDYEIGTTWGGAVELEEFITDNHWKMTGHELDIENLVGQLEKNYSVTTHSFEESKADSDSVFRTIDPGKIMHFELELNGK